MSDDLSESRLSELEHAVAGCAFYIGVLAEHLGLTLRHDNERSRFSVHAPNGEEMASLERSAVRALPHRPSGAAD